MREVAGRVLPEALADVTAFLETERLVRTFSEGWLHQSEQSRQPN
ncbi:hypothetical protein HNR61_002715 [Actinomadura namibiensis]|uniref:Uncharacterized protein n=1 Tax=Actinomadura namibiensis TaxID=182080 RepID=A0A7W3LMY3_ACTNM|nr:hypothetical protein [Actinomadura namibiensis]